MKMNYVDALNHAIAILNTAEQTDETAKAVEKLTALATTLANRNANRTPMSEEAKTKRKAETAAKRAELISTVAPILRKHLSKPVTAKELFAAAQAELPEDFTWNRVQNVLIREMAPELIRTERKKGGDTYQIKG